MATAKTKQHVKHLQKMCHLTYKVDNDLLDINCEGRDHVNDEELQDFGNSIIDIGRRTSAFYKDLCAKEVSIFNANTNLLYARQRAHEGKEFRRKCAVGEIQLFGDCYNPPQQHGNHTQTSPDLGLHPGQDQDPDKHQGQVQDEPQESAAAVETKHTTLARCLGPDQDGDTEEINTGDEAVNNNATELPETPRLSPPPPVANPDVPNNEATWTQPWGPYGSDYLEHNTLLGTTK